MPSLSEYIALEIDGETISLQEVLRFAKWGRSTFIKDAVDAVLIRQAAAERGIKVSDEEFQQEADKLRPGWLRITFHTRNGRRYLRTR